MNSEHERNDFARNLRKNSAPSEARLWKALRNRFLGGFKFRRQHVVGPYVVDFVCLKCKLIVEVDGESHLPRKSEDAKRSHFLELDGWKIIRFWNTEVFDDLEPVREAIYQECLRRSQR